MLALLVVSVPTQLVPTLLVSDQHESDDVDDDDDDDEDDDEDDADDVEDAEADADADDVLVVMLRVDVNDDDSCDVLVLL